MGLQSSKNFSSIAVSDSEMIKIQENFKKKYMIPIEVQVAHYTPCIFPLVPIINEQINKLCVDSWKRIVNNKHTTESGIEISGITLFYNDFYARLKIVDESQKIEGIFTAHSTGHNKIAEKGAIIIRIINYVLSIKSNDEQTQYRLYVLGKAHTKRAIRPYMYSIFVQTMLYTISNQLGVYATHEVMEAWVNMFSFIMKSMLPPAIDGQTLDMEMCINSRTEFSTEAVKTQVGETQQTKSKQTSITRNSSLENIESLHSTTESIFHNNNSWMKQV